MIQQIRIQNFRSLIDVTVDLDPLTVLIGRSGTGKSNFVRAIRGLRELLRIRNLSGMHFNYLPYVYAGSEKTTISYSLRFLIEGLGDPFEYDLTYDYTDSVKNELLRQNDRVLFHQQNSKWVVQPPVVPVPSPSGVMLGAIPGLQESTFAYVALQSGIGCYEFPGVVLAGQGHEGQPADQGFADGGENYLRVAERILADLKKASSWRHIARGMRAVNAAASSLTLNAPTPDQLTVGYQLNGKLATFDVRQESEGFRRYLAHMLALYQNPSKQTLIFEHPEAGLHPGALESLAEEFMACPKDGRGQVILTTHSPQLLDYFPPDSIRVVDIEKLSTRIGPIAPEQLASLRESLLQPGELLTADPARLPGQLAEVPE